MNPPTAIAIADFERGKQDWGSPDKRFLRSELPPAPRLPLREVFSPRLANWIEGAAEAKSAPADYVVAAVIAVCGSLVGNTRWSMPWDGWAEPPILWSVVIGLPSANKSPGLDAVLIPVRSVERVMREKVQAEINEWRDQSEIAKMAEGAWREAVKLAMKAGDETPAKPQSAEVGPMPSLPRLAVSDPTVEKLSIIVSQQPRGLILYRDELAGWLQGMTRYSGGGSDRPFWLEAYGGRGYSVERMGRDPVYIDRLSVGVIGGIQPDRLRSLLMKTDDDGLLARFMPIWPDRVPLKRPSAFFNEQFIQDITRRLLDVQMVTGEDGMQRPWFVPFSEDARDLLDAFRHQVREWENGTEGLLLSFMGKLPGIAVRLSLVLGMLDFAAGEVDEPREITDNHFGRAAHFIEAYLIPMARRSYSDGATKEERAGRRLVGLIREKGWRQFSAREVLRSEKAGLTTSAELDPILKALVEGDVVRLASGPASDKGGRPHRLFSVNPQVLGGRE